MSTNPRVTARLASALYFISVVPSGYSVFILRKLFVRGDPAATASAILGSEGLFRLGFVADIVGIMLFFGAMLFFYELLKPASARTALFMLCVCVMGCSIQTLNSLQDLTVLLFLKGANALAGLTTAQSQSLGYVFVLRHSLTYTLALAIFGVSSGLIGLLVLKSTFLPRVLGVLMLIDGLGFLTFGFSTFLSPGLPARLYPYLPMGTALIGEAPLMLWLLVKGVNAARWEEQAAAVPMRLQGT